VAVDTKGVDNLLWSAPRIHGELLKLGFEVALSTVSKYMVKRRGPPSQGWRTFLLNHAPDTAAMDFFWIDVTTIPTAEWVVRQITEAFPWGGAPRYVIRDRDRIYGVVVTRRLLRILIDMGLMEMRDDVPVVTPVGDDEIS
jgi:hypothetical protein